MLPFFLIVKALTLLGVDVQWNKEELESKLQVIDTVILQAEIDVMARMLGTIQVILILIQSVVQSFKNSDKITVSVFTEEECNKARTSVESIGEPAGESGKYIYRKISDDADENLRYHLVKVKALPQDFRIEACLTTCRQTVVSEDVNKRCLLTVLTLLQGFVSETQLNQAVEWAKDPAINDTPKSVSSWLTNKLNITGLDNRLQACFNNGHPHEEEELGRIHNMLDRNDELLSMIKKECFEKLEKLVENAADTPPGVKDAWKNMVRAMHGIVAWQIHHQAEVAVREAKAVLDRLNP